MTPDVKAVEAMLKIVQLVLKALNGNLNTARMPDGSMIAGKTLLV